MLCSASKKATKAGERAPQKRMNGFTRGVCRLIYTFFDALICVGLRFRYGGSSLRQFYVVRCCYLPVLQVTLVVHIRLFAPIFRWRPVTRHSRYHVHVGVQRRTSRKVQQWYSPAGDTVTEVTLRFMRQAQGLSMSSCDLTSQTLMFPFTLMLMIFLPSRVAAKLFISVPCFIGIPYCSPFSKS